jgi:hypothetical protein
VFSSCPLPSHGIRELDVRMIDCHPGDEDVLN